MQPSTALEKAHERLGKAKTMNSEFVVQQGLIKALQEVDSARRSPGMTDFGRLRATVRTEAGGPSARLVARNALRLEEDILAWLRIQELIAQHLRALSEVTGESLRATQQ